MELNCLELFMKTLSGININTVIFRKDCSNLELVDNRFRMHLYENYPYGSTLSLSSQKIKKNTLVCKTDEFSHTYFFLRIPEEFLSESRYSEYMRNCTSLRPVRLTKIPF